MAKCDVCGKTSLLPEKFGSINICKICFMKANGPFWKRQFERYEDAEKHRNNALEYAHKQNFPQPVVTAINEFFISQIDSMLKCDCCGHPVLHRQALGKANICSKCFSKINTSAWKETSYDDNKEVEVNRQKILKRASKNGFPPLVIDGINAHFDSKIQKGLICTIDGGTCQKLKVFETHCVLITEDYFEIEEMSKRYGKALKRTRPHSTSFSDSAAKALALGSIIPGSTIVQTGIRAAASAAISVTADRLISGKGVFKVTKGSFRIDYLAYSSVDYADCGEKENDVGFIRFCHNGGDSSNDIVFLFRYHSVDFKNAYKEISNSMEKAHQTVQQPQAQPLVKSSVADEILKFKQLLDMGAITQEEFEAKKKELLEM